TNESAAAAEIARLYPSVDHVLVDSRGYDFVKTVRMWSDAMGEPANNVINLLWYSAILDRAKSRDIGVVLEGAEGNATLSWYTWSILGDFFTHGRWKRMAHDARALHRHGALSYKTAARYATRGLVPKWLSR